jgi:hypothetical protein
MQLVLGAKSRERNVPRVWKLPARVNMALQIIWAGEDCASLVAIQPD